MYCEAVIRMLTWAFPEHYSKDQGHQFASWDRCERCVKHALRVSTVIHTHHVSMDQDGPYGDLLLRCSWYLYERETYGPARQLVQRAISAFRDMTSKEYLNAVDLLGLIDMDLNQPRAALSAIEKVLEVRRSISPPDDPFTAYSLNALGLAYTELPDLDKAYRAHQEAMSIRERIGSDRVGNSYSNMASLLLRMGKPDEAEDMLKRSAYLTDLSDEPFLASGNPRHSGDMVLLSRIRLQQGTIDDALRLATAALKFRQERLGKRLKTCDSMYDVARILHMQGGAAEAM